MTTRDETATPLSGPILAVAPAPTAPPPGFIAHQYFYGSYALSHALFRPTRLQLWLDDGPTEQSCVLRLRLDTFVRGRAEGAWDKLMSVFWKRFGRWCEKAIPNNWLR